MPGVDQTPPVGGLREAEAPGLPPRRERSVGRSVAVDLGGHTVFNPRGLRGPKNLCRPDIAIPEQSDTAAASPLVRGGQRVQCVAAATRPVREVRDRHLLNAGRSRWQNDRRWSLHPPGQSRTDGGAGERRGGQGHPAPSSCGFTLSAWLQRPGAREVRDLWHGSSLGYQRRQPVPIACQCPGSSLVIASERCMGWPLADFDME